VVPADQIQEILDCVLRGHGAIVGFIQTSCVPERVLVYGVAFAGRRTTTCAAGHFGKRTTCQHVDNGALSCAGLSEYDDVARNSTIYMDSLPNFGKKCAGAYCSLSLFVKFLGTANLWDWLLALDDSYVR